MNTHTDAPNADAGPHCPACGFRVFNRRYPKCESCGVELPEDIAYSASERHAIMEGEESLARAVARQQRPSNESGFGALDEAVVSTIVSATSR